MKHQVNAHANPNEKDRKSISEYKGTLNMLYKCETEYDTCTNGSTNTMQKVSDWNTKDVQRNCKDNTNELQMIVHTIQMRIHKKCTCDYK